MRFCLLTFKRTHQFLAISCLTLTDRILAYIHRQILCELFFLALVLQAGELGMELRPLAPKGGLLQLIHHSGFSTAVHGSGVSNFCVFALYTSLDMASSANP